MQVALQPLGFMFSGHSLKFSLFEGNIDVGALRRLKHLYSIEENYREFDASNVSS